MTNPGYKLTEIGEIPDDWDIKPFGELIDLRSSKGAPKTKDVYIIPMEYIPDNSTSCKFKKSVSGDVIPPTYCEPGDVLMPKITPSVENGKIGIVPELPNSSAFATSEVFPVVSGPLVDNLFIFYLLKFSPYRQALVNSMIGSTGRQRVPKSFLLSMNVCFPQLLEQQRIAEILSAADKKIELIDKESQATEKLKKGLMQTLLTRGIGHTKFKLSEIGEIPEEWEIKSLNELTTKLVGGGTPSTSEPEFWNGNIPWTRGASLRSHYLETGERCITTAGLENSSTKIVPSGNILMASRVSVGNVSINTVDMAISQDVTGFIIRNELVTSDFLYWCLKKQSNNIKKMVQGSTIKGVLKTDLLQIRVVLPSLDEQKVIAEIINLVDKKLEYLIAKEGKMNLLKKSLLQTLLTGRVRIKISKNKGDN